MKLSELGWQKFKEITTKQKQKQTKTLLFFINPDRHQEKHAKIYFAYYDLLQDEIREPFTALGFKFQLLDVHRDRRDYYGRGAQDVHLDFHTAPEL